MNLEWADAPPPSRWKKADRPEEWAGDRQHDGDWIEMYADPEAWRWDDLANDPALVLDMTDGGFCWTELELAEALTIARHARAFGVNVDGRSIRKIERTLGL